MKKEIKEYLIQKKLVFPKYNNNISRKKYWEKRNDKWWEYLSTEFENHKQKIYGLSFSIFIRYFFFDITTYKNRDLLFIDDDIKTFCDNFKRKTARPDEKLYKFRYPQMKKYVRENNLLEASDFREQAYIIKHSIKEIPKCIECNKKVSWNKGEYHKFCSQLCQMKYNNKIKDTKLSDLSDDEIREIIKNIPPDRRNLTNKKIAENFLNIERYINKLNLGIELENKEKIYIFLTKNSDIFCVCGNKKVFHSQVKGYAKTCSRKKCITITRGNTIIDYSEDNPFRSKNGTKLDKGYIYVVEVLDNIFKIGITKNPNIRLKEFKKFFGDIKLIYSVYKSCDVYLLERKLHNIFKNQYQYVGEFGGKTETFNLSDKDLQKIEGIINEY